ncbi:MAG: signal recognition particle-docking protein FtsY [Ruminococcaceae bacterium]|nr:signal recognition particle-docking protein FtsY [Oscillospiraceae bacterium]
MGLFQKIKEGLTKTRNSMTSVFGNLFSSLRPVDEDMMEELTDALIMADVGVELTEEIIDQLRDRIKEKHLKDSGEVKTELCDILTGILKAGEGDFKLTTKPSVILVIGVNGVGKTTTIGKLAGNFVQEGKKVLLAAGDTFRAAASEQLSIWAGRAGCDIVKHGEGADPAAVVFDAIQAAKARGTDILICDTAGRLQNKQNLMNELSKINRVITRELPEADMEVLLVVDATTGQNGLLQARAFEESAGITGLVLTKLDGTAKGGIVCAISKELSVPVKRICVGETMEDMLPFDAESFATALFEA